MVEGVEHVTNLITRYTILEAIYLDTSSHAKPATMTHYRLPSPSYTRQFLYIRLKHGGITTKEQQVSNPFSPLSSTLGQETEPKHSRWQAQ